MKAVSLFIGFCVGVLILAAAHRVYYITVKQVIQAQTHYIQENCNNAR